MKKLRWGEFQEFGFSVELRTPSTLSTNDGNSLLDSLIEMIEQNSLLFGGGGLDDWHGFVALNSRGTATEQHRQVVHRWLDGHPQIEDAVIGQLVDAGHTGTGIGGQ